MDAMTDAQVAQWVRAAARATAAQASSFVTATIAFQEQGQAMEAHDVVLVSREHFSELLLAAGRRLLPETQRPFEP